MREILELCVELDTFAGETYGRLAGATDDEKLATTFLQLAKEERQHVEWWRDLLVAWESGLVPDIADGHGLSARLTEIRDELVALPPADIDQLDTDGMLDVAVRMEFFMLDHTFSELADYMEPGSYVEHREAYFRHVSRLIEAVEEHYSQRRLAGFLAKVLLRSYRDQQRLAALTVRDQLTGLYNRRGLLAHLSQWLAWSERYGRPLAVVLIDIDHFKQVNDTRGHAAGDEALRLVADALRRGVRTSDVLGRFGGDEFLVLAPETDRGELQGLMDRLVASVRDMSAEVGGEPTLTVSAGGTWSDGGTRVEAETMIAAADASLYEAKEEGRDHAGSPRPHISVN
ncbi:MAG: diguanylate cyclase [Coriobacteriia bacterium]|nr:diguanylate cyclase [Coriobacteriia bacterium]